MSRSWRKSWTQCDRGRSQFRRREVGPAPDLVTVIAHRFRQARPGRTQWPEAMGLFLWAPAPTTRTCGDCVGTHLSVGTLDQFDEDDNSVATTLMDGYYGLAGTWLGL